MDTYNEADAFDAYIDSHLQLYLTEFERRVWKVAIIREKARCSESDGVAKLLMNKIGDEPAEIIEASNVGYDKFREQIRQRLFSLIAAGELSVNRCPECNRIVRTPLAQQCLWCGHDWHHSA